VKWYSLFECSKVDCTCGVRKQNQKSSANGTTNYLYDGANSVAEVDSAATLLARYTQGAGIDEPLAEIRNGTVGFCDQDGLVSVTSLSNPTAALSNTYSYDAFGNVAASTGSLTNPFQYTGRDFDPETGLRYYRARYCSSQTGRFISEDPIGFGGGIDFYAYVGNNPANFVDPTRLAPCYDIGAFVKALDRNAKKVPNGHCGRYVGWALKAGGLNIGSHNGKDYGPYLQDSGFTTVSTDGYTPQTGDVAVFQNYPGQEDQAGHIQGWDGRNWVSDFVQPSPGRYPGRPPRIHPGKPYREAKVPFVIYRPPLCPTSGTDEHPILNFLLKLVVWM